MALQPMWGHGRRGADGVPSYRWEPAQQPSVQLDGAMP